jgi:hypothetical protein
VQDSASDHPAPPLRQTGAFVVETSPETALGRRIPLIVMA